MSKMAKKADAFIQNHSSDLQTIFTKIKLLENLNNKVIFFLEERLKNVCQVVNLANNVLTLLVSSGSVATQLRFSEPDLLRKFQTEPLLKKIQHIHCKVRPAQTPLRRVKPVQKVPLLSANTAALVQDIAETIDDPKLKEVLKKIATHTEATRLRLK